MDGSITYQSSGAVFIFVRFQLRSLSFAALGFIYFKCYVLVLGKLDVGHSFYNASDFIFYNVINYCAAVYELCFVI